MTSSSLDTKQILLLGIIIIAFMVLGRPYFFGHAPTKRTQSTEGSDPLPSFRQPTVPASDSSQRTEQSEKTDSDSLSEIEKLLQ